MEKKVIRLTESELVKLVQKVIKEDELQSSMKTSIMSTISDLDLSGIDINKCIDMEMSEDDLMLPEENPQLEPKELDFFYQIRNDIGHKVMDMCTRKESSENIIKFLKGLFTKYKSKQVSEQMSPAKFYLGGIAIIALLIFIVKGIVSARSNRFCNRWERRMRRMPGFQ
jgi:hypothetical protein